MHQRYSEDFFPHPATCICTVAEDKHAERLMCNLLQLGFLYQHSKTSI